jgi:hypothetical protein
MARTIFMSQLMSASALSALENALCIVDEDDSSLAGWRRQDDPNARDWMTTPNKKMPNYDGRTIRVNGIPLEAVADQFEDDDIIFEEDAYDPFMPSFCYLVRIDGRRLDIYFDYIQSCDNVDDSMYVTDAVPVAQTPAFSIPYVSSYLENDDMDGFRDIVADIAKRIKVRQETRTNRARPYWMTCKTTHSHTNWRLEIRRSIQLEKLEEREMMFSQA